MEQFPMFQTGSGRAMSISMASVQKAKAVLDENNVNTGKIGYSTVYIYYKPFT
jgi:breast cancer 2 susceptibility protein